jgi:2-furoyl-CoA dehydrogenase large subunit
MSDKEEMPFLRDLSKSRFIGKPIERLEDFKIVRGKAGYTDDFEFPDQHYAAILHSPYAHAKIKSIDISKALSLPGVVACITGKEVAQRTPPITPRATQRTPTSHYIMAVEKVRYMGEPVALVVAKDKYIAHDALDLIEVEYEPLPVVTRIEEALKPTAPLIYEELGTNELIHDKFVFGDVEEAFKKAHTVISERFKIHRYASTPLETYVVNAYFDQIREELVVYANDQQPGRTIQTMERMLNIPVSKIKLYVPLIGGGFGYKLAIWQYVVLMSLATIITGKPVKWVQTRMESLYGPHRPSGFMDAELAISREGKILGMKLHEYVADGNFPYVAGLYSLIKFANMSGIYRIPCYSFEYHSIATNLPPIVQDRGVGKPFMTFVLERIVDLASKRLGIDPFEFRLMNAINPSLMPYTTPSGEVYESGDYPKTIRLAMEHINYKELRRRQAELRKEGRFIGIGVACGIEPGTSNLGYYYLSKPGTPEFVGSGQMATVEILPGGSIKVNMNGPEIGTGHVTSIAQVVGEIFNIDPRNVTVEFQYDSTYGNLGYAGTYSNAFNDVYIGAIMKASIKLRSKVLSIASHELETSIEDLYLEDGFVKSKSDPSKRISLREIASIAYNRLLSLPPQEEPGLRVTSSYVNPSAKKFKRNDFNVQLTHSNSVHVAVVEVDIGTGKVKFLDYLIVHDAGEVINPKIVEGLAIGSTASGIGGTLYEEFVFDENGNNLTLTFADYLKPTAMEIPDIKVVQVKTPAPNTPLGTKAVGEGGALTSLAAIANAIEDALSPFNVKVNELPITQEKILNMVKKFKGV